MNPMKLSANSSPNQQGPKYKIVQVGKIMDGFEGHLKNKNFDKGMFIYYRKGGWVGKWGSTNIIEGREGGVWKKKKLAPLEGGLQK